MQDLRSKLELYKSKSNPQKVLGRQKNEEREIHKLVPGTLLENSCGRCYLIEARYPLSYTHGGVTLGSVLASDLAPLTRVFPGFDTGCPLEDCLFLDTETTGLSGGAGTVAFLVGAGRFERDCFTIRQYFMRDYDEEAALLTELDRDMRGYRGLVTFNGKAFDWNLLTSRFIFNRIRPKLSDPVHLDLLYPARRIWRQMLESCRLASLEENILGEYRHGDLPGAMIPSVYFKYLQDRDAADIKKVVEHNEKDIISMVSLLSVIASKIGNPSSFGKGEELFGLGRIYEADGDYAMVVKCFEACVRQGSRVREAAARRLASVYKRTGDYGRAVEHWERLMAEGCPSSILPYVELAKYYEHKERNYERAIGLVERALKITSSMGLCRSVELKDLKRRLERLNRKAGRVNSG